MQISVCFISLSASDLCSLHAQGCIDAGPHQRTAAPVGSRIGPNPAVSSLTEPYSALLDLSEPHFLPYWALLRLIGP